MSDSKPLAPARKPMVRAKPAPRVAFDPLDPQWQGGAKASPADTPDAASTSAPPARASRPAPRALSVEEQRAKEQADAVVIRARRLFVVSDTSSAREQIKAALAIDATNASALELLGDIFLAKAEQEKAIQVFKRGAEFHPHHAAFEEKIALALLDIEQEKRDKQLADLLLQNPSLDSWAERKPALAATLSLLVPGAGQAYNDQAERGAVLFGAAIVSFGGWYWILDRATANLSGRGASQLFARTSLALEQMGGLAKLGFWLLLLAWMGVVAFAAFDAYRGAVEANRARRPFGV